jgi:hypothetical protein
MFTGANSLVCNSLDFATWGPNPPPGGTQKRHNIGLGSSYKIYLDKHFRKYMESTTDFNGGKITAVLHFRNITKGLVIHNNTFDQIHTVAGGSIYVQDFSNTFGTYQRSDIMS